MTRLLRPVSAPRRHRLLLAGIGLFGLLLGLGTPALAQNPDPAAAAATPAPAAATPGPAAAPAAHNAERTPLLLEGKRTLYQRVLLRPEARLAASPDQAAAQAGPPLPAFSVYYVYGRQGGAEGWLEIGRASRGGPDGWVKAERTIEWKQGLTLAFLNPAGRERALFLRSAQDYQSLLDRPDLGPAVAGLRQAALAGNPGPVLAVEPEAFIDIRKQFYLLPILDAKTILTERAEPVKLLEVASVPAQTTPPPVSAVEQRREILSKFSAGIVFVIDTTLSMDPYIERTREAVQRIYERLGSSALADRFRFGVVAYRNSTKATPGLEYVTKVVQPIDSSEPPKALLERLSGLKAATISSSAFYEDPFAGLKTAISDLDWSGFGGRYVVLITDASGRTAGDPLAATGLDPAGVRQLAREKDIALFALHLQTPAGLADHARARAQYTELTRFPGLKEPLYYPIKVGSVDQFGRIVDKLAGDVLQQVAETVGLPLAELASPEAAAAAAAAEADKEAEQRLAEQNKVVAYAMRLAYLGRQEGTAAPDVLRGWTIDRDPANPRQPALDVRVLLSKNQLSDLQAALRLVLDQGRANRLSPEGFFRQLQAAALASSRDPRGLGHLDRLGDLVGEYLDGLPYTSEVMRLTDDDWRRMGPSAQTEFLNGIEAKLRLYQAFHNESHLWVSFDQGRVPGDAVFPIPLEALP